jgi:hypothetical protein
MPVGGDAAVRFLAAPSLPSPPLRRGLGCSGRRNDLRPPRPSPSSSRASRSRHVAPVPPLPPEYRQTYPATASAASANTATVARHSENDSPNGRGRPSSASMRASSSEPAAPAWSRSAAAMPSEDEAGKPEPGPSGTVIRTAPKERRPFCCSSPSPSSCTGRGRAVMSLRPAGRVGAAAEEAEERAGWREAGRGREGDAAAREGGRRWFVSRPGFGILLVRRPLPESRRPAGGAAGRGWRARFDLRAGARGRTGISAGDSVRGGRERGERQR